MAGLLDSLSKGIATVNVKSGNMMEKNKIKTYISTLEKEIADLKAQVGEITYHDWAENTYDFAKIEPALQAISNKYVEINHQKEKMEELDKEEKQILGNASQQPVIAGESVRFCPSCGAQNENHYKFCMKCGSPLQE